jgi:hypothetical protein
MGAFRDIAAPGESLRPQVDDGRSDARDRVSSFEFNTGERSFVALMPVAVPRGEADQAARFSLSSFRDHWTLPPHCAHLLVTLHSPTESPPKVRLSRLTSLLAAVTKVSPAVGVYWGDAGATHDPEFWPTSSVKLSTTGNFVPRSGPLGRSGSGCEPSPGLDRDAGMA